MIIDIKFLETHSS